MTFASSRVTLRKSIAYRKQWALICKFQKIIECRLCSRIKNAATLKLYYIERTKKCLYVRTCALQLNVYQHILLYYILKCIQNQKFKQRAFCYKLH